MIVILYINGVIVKGVIVLENSLVVFYKVGYIFMIIRCSNFRFLLLLKIGNNLK